MVKSIVNPDRFRRVFVETWNRLPSGVREVLSRWWSLGESRVYFAGNWEDRGGHLAHCSNDGRTLAYLAAVVERLPDDQLPTFIVHELAHAFFFAIRDPYHCSSPLPQDMCKELAEALVHRMSDLWGFPSRRLSLWCRENNGWLTTICE